MALLLGSAVTGVVYDDFTQANGTALNSYGKWTTSGTGTADVQSNAGRLVQSNSSISITSVGSPAKNFIMVQGTLSGNGTTVASISVFGASVSFIRTGGVNYAIDWSFAAVRTTGNVWYYFMRSTNSSGAAVDQHGTVSTGTTTQAPGFNFTITCSGGNGTNTATFDNVLVG